MSSSRLNIVGARRPGVREKAAAMGVDEAYVSELVNAFYGRIRADRLLGPIFDEAIGDRWGFHLEKMKDFWASVALGAARYSGEPIPAHKKLTEARPRHFDLWLELFEETLRDTAPTPEAAACFMDHAVNIGKGLRTAMFGASGSGRSAGHVHPLAARRVTGGSPMSEGLPEGLVKYFESEEFTEATVPEKLMTEHATKPGVWARIVVLDGSLEYVVPGAPERSRRLETGDAGVIRPAEPHRVELPGMVRFKLELYRTGDADDTDS